MKKIRHFIHHFIMTYIPQGMRRNSLTCSEVAMLLANKSELKKMTALKLKMHLFICENCLNYKKQIQIIDNHSEILGIISLTASQRNQINNSKSSIISQYSQRK